MVLAIFKKEVDQTFQCLGVVSILIFMLLSKFLLPYSITRSRSLLFKDITASLIFCKSVIRALRKVI